MLTPGAAGGAIRNPSLDAQPEDVCHCGEQLPSCKANFLHWSSLVHCPSPPSHTSKLLLPTHHLIHGSNHINSSTWLDSPFNVRRPRPSDPPARESTTWPPGPKSERLDPLARAVPPCRRAAWPGDHGDRGVARGPGAAVGVLVAVLRPGTLVAEGFWRAEDERSRT